MDKEKLNLRKYNKYLDKTIVGIVLAIFLLAAALIYVWVYYLPQKEPKALKVNFIDDSKPSQQSNVGKGSNLQSPGNNDLGVTRNNDPLGNYQKAQLKQFCSQTDTSNAINLPSDFKYQECDDGLKCTSGILKDGPICLADIDSNCNNLSDCVPGADACLGGKCVVIDTDNKINIPCDSDIDCQTNQFEDQFNNHICFKFPGQRKGFCKVDLFPFDGGCRIDSDCVFIQGHEIKCIKSNNFNDTFFNANIISQKPFTEPYKGVSLTIELDVNFNLNILNTAGTNFMLNILLPDNGIIVVSDYPKPFTIPDGGVCTLNDRIELMPLEFFSRGYPDNYDNISGVSVYFGDYQAESSFVGRDKLTGGPYGICLDLLPIGSPSNLKIGNITIPGLTTIANTVADNRIITQSRVGFGTGKMGDFCFSKPQPNTNILGCGYIKYLGDTKKMECGYNYNFEEVFLDNLYYNLRPDPFEIQYVGSCMIKNSIQFQPCNNATLGCIEPNICLPVLDPITNQLINVCIAPMRSQICENNVCPTNYTCQGTSCLSNKGNLAIKSADCLNKNAGNTINFFVYNKDNQQYYNLNLETANYLNNGDDIDNITFKMGTCYQTVDSYKSIGIENKSFLPSKLLIYGKAQSTTNSIKGAVYNLSNNKYSYYSNFNITPSTNNTIQDINLVGDDKIAVVQKRTIQELREIALKVSLITPGDGNISIIFSATQAYWYNFNMYIDGKDYPFYLFSPTNSDFNLKGNGSFKIASRLPSDTGPIYDHVVTSTSGLLNLLYDLTDDNFDLYLIINTNQLAFNNNVYYKKAPLTDNVKYVLPGSELTFYLPDNFETNYFDNISEFGESFVMSPKVYTNNNTVLKPDYQLNTVQLQNGDRIKITDEFTLLNYSEFAADSISGAVEEIDISGGKYMYIELVQPNTYYNSDTNSYVDLNNYICNLHGDFISSQGSVPNLNVSSKGIYNENLGVRKDNEDLGIRFAVYDDMVNYNINFISLTTGDNSYSIVDSNTFIGVSSVTNGRIYITNGLNNSFSYNFESDTKVKFNFDENNNVFITSQVEGISGFYTYLQKVNYQVDINVTQSSTSDPDYKEFNLASETNYDKFYQYAFSDANNKTYLGNIKFKYVKEVVVPNAKSLYFDTSVKSNLIDTVEENLLDTGDNNISLFTTFRNNGFIEEDGNVSQRILDIDSQNIYSNKAPPIAAYSRLNDFNITTDNDDIKFSYQGFKDQNYNYVQLDNGISLNYTLKNNCVNNDTNFITFRDPEIIEVFLNNPASEIVLQKQGTNIADYNITKVREGASIASKAVKDNSKNNIYKGNQFLDGASNIDNFQVKYESSSGVLETKYNEINRSAVAIEEYNVYVDKNNNIKEFLIVKLNAKIDQDSDYIKDCFDNIDRKWKLWHNNIVELEYFPDFNYYFYTDYYGKLVIDEYPNTGEKNMITIIDGSPIWTSTKGNNYVLPEGFSPSSFNKLVVNDGSQFEIFNTHDNYFYRKNFVASGVPTNDVSKLMLNQDGTFNYQNTDFTHTALSNVNNFIDLDIESVELAYDISHFSSTIVSTPGIYTPAELTTPSLNSSLPKSFIAQSGTDTLLVNGNVDIGNIISYMPLNLDALDDINYYKSFQWNLPYLYNGANPGLNPTGSGLVYNKSMPKKVKVFDVSGTGVVRLFMPFKFDNNTDNNYFNSIPDVNYTNTSFVCFKKKYTNTLPLINFYNYNANYQAVANDPYFETTNINTLNLIGNNNSDYIYSINDYKAYIDGVEDSDLVYPASISCESSLNSNFDGRNGPWKPTSVDNGDGGNLRINSFVFLINYIDVNSNISRIAVYLSYDQSSTGPFPGTNSFNFSPVGNTKNFTASKSGNNPGTWTYSLDPFTKQFSYDPTKTLPIIFNNFRGSSSIGTYTSNGFGIEAIYGGYEDDKTTYTLHQNTSTELVIGMEFVALGKTYTVIFTFSYATTYPANDVSKNNLTISNTRTKSDSFKREIINYNNSFRPLVYDNTMNTVNLDVKYFYGINYVVDGSYDMTFFCSYNNSTTGSYNYAVVGNFDIRPLYSSNILLPDKYLEYSNKLYMINNLFLSSLSTDFEYINLKITKNFFISNKVYININSDLITTYKGLGNIPFKLTSSPIIIQNQNTANDFNLINYQEIRFPRWFTERYISRFNSIPKIKSIFTSIRQGNIFNNMVYYPFLSYSTIEDSDTSLENDQLLYMTTDIDQKTVLESRGVPYTMSLSLDEITVEQLEKLVQFEPYNKFIFTLGYACLS